MIRFQESVPDYYIEESRDFQVLCRLYDFTYNALKYNIDSISNLTNTRFAKDTILPLIGDKFGIYDKDSYSNRFLLEALPIALKYKGSLKAVNILINAFLDSEEIFDYVTAFYSKDEESALEISELLNMDIKPYSIVILLSDYPNMVNLRVLNEYLNMVIPSGVIVDYMFGKNITILEKFKYKEYVFLFFTNTSDEIDAENNKVIKMQDVSLIANRETKYSGQYPSGHEHNEFMDKVLGISENSSVDVNSVAISTVSQAPIEEDIEES